jgi:hypothetical protein
MALITGAPLGNIIEQETEVFVEGAPWIYYQDYEANHLNNPDGDGYYWDLSGTTNYPVFSLACYEDVALGDDVTVNAIRCDKSGDTAVIQKRNHLELTLALSTLFPLSTIAPIIRGEGSPFSGTGLEKMGIGPINNNDFYRVYLPKVYDEAAADYVSITLHKAQFVDAWTIAMPSGDKWMLGGIVIWGLADDTLPSAQQFATVIRSDLSALP